MNTLNQHYDVGVTEVELRFKNGYNHKITVFGKLSNFGGRYFCDNSDSIVTDMINGKWITDPFSNCSYNTNEIFSFTKCTTSFFVDEFNKPIFNKNIESDNEMWRRITR